MLTPPTPKGFRAIASQPFLGKETLTVGDVSVTITVPCGLGFYFPVLMANWNVGEKWIISQTAAQCVLGFATPAPAGGEILWAIFY